MNYYDKVEKYLYIPTIIFMITIVVLVIFQIISRYILSIPTPWAHEIIMFSFVWWVFFAATIGLRKKRHLGVDSLTNLINQKSLKVGKALVIFREMTIMAFLLFIFCLGVRATLDHMGLKTAILGVPLGLMIYIVFPIFSILMIFFTIESVLNIFCKKGNRVDRY